VVSCGKSRDIGDGVDASGARGGEAGGLEPDATGGTGGTVAAGGTSTMNPGGSSSGGDEEGCTNHPSGTHGYKVTIDPVDVTVLRFNDEYATEGTRYLARED
jgi:hypothetical protein